MSMANSWPAGMLTALFEEPMLAALPVRIRWTAIGLLHLNPTGSPQPLHEGMLKAAIWPLDDSVTAEDLTLHLLRLEEAGYCQIGSDATGRLVYRLNLTPAHPRYSSVTYSEGEGGGERAEADLGSPQERPPRLPGEVYRTELGPAPWCPEHPGNSLEECGPCGGQREHARRWRAERALEKRYARTVRDEA